VRGVEVDAPVLSGRPSSQVSHIHEQSTHWREAGFAQLLELVNLLFASNSSGVLFIQSTEEMKVMERLNIRKMRLPFEAVRGNQKCNQPELFLLFSTMFLRLAVPSCRRDSLNPFV
jgi:hypothetical protein